MRSTFNISYQKYNETTGKAENNIHLNVYVDALDNKSHDYFAEGLIAMCHNMSDYLADETLKED